jgi:hypothetical protein
MPGQRSQTGRGERMVIRRKNRKGRNSSRKTGIPESDGYKTRTLLRLPAEQPYFLMIDSEFGYGSVVNVNNEINFPLAVLMHEFSSPVRTQG